MVGNRERILEFINDASIALHYYDKFMNIKNSIIKIEDNSKLYVLEDFFFSANYTYDIEPYYSLTMSVFCKNLKNGVVHIEHFKIQLTTEDILKYQKNYQNLAEHIFIELNKKITILPKTDIISLLYSK